MRIAATGGTGFVGSHCVRALLADGHEVVLLARARARADALIHAANVDRLNAGDAELVQRVNIGGTRAVISAAAGSGLDPIVHVSSAVALLPSDRMTASSPVGRPTARTPDRRRRPRRSPASSRPRARRS